MTQAKTVTLDVRTLPPDERRGKVFALFDALAVGESLVIISDHDPRPLRFRLSQERAGKFQWDSQGQAPQAWQATIRRVAL